jgi:predicted nucleic acid-binding protein
MSLSRRIIFDTSAFYALVSVTDSLHTPAMLCYERILDWEWEIWTTSYVLAETQTLIHNRLGFECLKTFIEAVPDIMRILWVESSITEEAWKRMLANRGQRLSFIDWTTIVACEKLRASIFSFADMPSEAGLRVFPRPVTTNDLIVPSTT